MSPAMASLCCCSCISLSCSPGMYLQQVLQLFHCCITVILSVLLYSSGPTTGTATSVLCVLLHVLFYWNGHGLSTGTSVLYMTSNSYTWFCIVGIVICILKGTCNMYIYHCTTLDLQHLHELLCHITLATSRIHYCTIADVEHVH